jgi:hypothetical protein
LLFRMWSPWLPAWLFCLFEVWTKKSYFRPTYADFSYGNQIK